MRKEVNKRSSNYFQKVHRKWWWILLIFFAFFGLLIINRKLKTEEALRRNERLKEELRKQKGYFCSHQNPETEYGIDAVRFLTEWECTYCGKIINWGGKCPKPNQTITYPVLNSLAEKHLKECKKAQEFLCVIDDKKDDSLNYDNEEILRRKGYQDVDKIRNWGLIGRVILPTVWAKSRIGITRSLSVVAGKARTNRCPDNNVKYTEGAVLEELVFLFPRASSVIFQNFHELFEDKKPDPLFFPCGGSKRLNLYNRVIVEFFVWKIMQKGKKQNFNIFSSTINLHKFMPVGGESGTLAFYLALLSAYHQIPISRELAVSAFLNINNYVQVNYCPWCLQEEVIKNTQKTFSQHKISSVEGLEYKIPTAVKVGVKKLILAHDQKENYEKVIPAEIREKLKVYYVQTVEELESLLWQGEFS